MVNRISEPPTESQLIVVILFVGFEKWLILEMVPNICKKKNIGKKLRHPFKKHTCSAQVLPGFLFFFNPGTTCWWECQPLHPAIKKKVRLGMSNLQPLAGCETIKHSRLVAGWTNPWVSSWVSGWVSSWYTIHIYIYIMVGGWFPPIWKICNRQIGSWNPKVRGENWKISETTT